MADSESQYQRIILLNTLLSRSTTRVRNQIAPAERGIDLLKVLEARRTKKWAVEYFGADEEDDEEKRIEAGKGHDYIRLCHLRFEETKDYDYVTGLVEFMDASISKFAVVDYETFKGHEISGEKSSERGATAAHIVVRLPKDHLHDSGEYRCAVEAVHGITRSDIEVLFCRQLRRDADYLGLTFTAEVRKGLKVEKRDYRYTPRLELVADVGRSLATISGSGDLYGMIFTKRRDKQSTAGPVAAAHEDFVADVRIYVGANQGPPNPQDRLNWAERIQNDFSLRGFDTKILFRHANGGVVSGDVHKSVNAAADLLMCQREHISLEKQPKSWVSTIQSEIADKMRAIVDEDALWERRK